MLRRDRPSAMEPEGGPCRRLFGGRASPLRGYEASRHVPHTPPSRVGPRKRDDTRHPEQSSSPRLPHPSGSVVAGLPIAGPARAPDSNPAAAINRWRPPIWWQTCQLFGRGVGSRTNSHMGPEDAVAAILGPSWEEPCQGHGLLATSADEVVSARLRRDSLLSLCVASPPPASPTPSVILTLRSRLRALCSCITWALPLSFFFGLCLATFEHDDYDDYTDDEDGNDENGSHDKDNNNSEAGLGGTTSTRGPHSDAGLRPRPWRVVVEQICMSVVHPPLCSLGCVPTPPPPLCGQRHFGERANKNIDDP